VAKGSDLFISVWNLHRSPALWDAPEDFRPERFGPLDGPVPNEVRRLVGGSPGQPSVSACCVAIAGNGELGWLWLTVHRLPGLA
jgi:hypothetical protein